MADVNWAALDPALIDRINALRAARGEPPVEQKPDSEAVFARTLFATAPTQSDEIIQSIADQVCGIRIEKAMVANLRHRLEELKIEFDAIRSDSPKQIRDALEELAVALGRAAIAVEKAPQEPYFFENAVRRETGASSTTLLRALYRLSEETSQRLRAFRVPRTRNVSDEKLCAHFTLLLFSEMSKARPTTTPTGAFITASEFLAELFLGSDKQRSMTTACREVLEGRFPGTPDL